MDAKENAQGTRRCARPKSGRRLALAAALAAFSGPAAAQLLPDLPAAIVRGTGDDPGVTVQSRQRPAYDEAGIREGPALIFPEIEETVGYDSAPLGANGGGSLAFRTHPSVRIADQNPDHPYDFSLDVTNTHYPGLPAQDRTDFSVSGGTSLSLGMGHLTLGASHQSLHQDRTDLDAVPSDQPIAFRVDQIQAGYARSWDRLTLEPTLSLAAWRFGTATLSGVPVSQAYRNRDVVRLGLTARYELAPRREVQVALRTAAQAYTDTPAASPTSDSHQAELLAGFDEATDGLWHYRLLAGWEHRGYRFPGYHAHDAAVGEADLILVPDGMTTLTATVSRSIEDAAQEGVAGFIYTSARLTADYEWRRNILLRASGAVQTASLLDTAGRQSILTGGLEATWLLDRHFRVIGSYTLSLVRSYGSDAALGGDFARSLVLLTLRAGL